MIKYRISARGTRPLLMHNARLASPLNSYAKQISAISSKRTKTDDDRLKMARIEFEGSLYLDDDGRVIIPGVNLFATLIGGAKITRSGKKVERGLQVLTHEIPLIYDGPRDVDGLWGGGPGVSPFVDTRSVRVTTNRVDRTRPYFSTWGFEADVVIEPSILEAEDLSTIVDQAGRLVGLGDYRQAYGRFEAAVQPL
jgi:hypothetical protein